jgi:hypothetical protein
VNLLLACWGGENQLHRRFKLIFFFFFFFISPEIQLAASCWE